jgi:carbon-monoxide dehydrogenase small subunit
MARLNGLDVQVEVPAHETIADLLRDRLGLTGTKVSCDAQVCGTCTVLLDGRPVSGCTVLAVEADGRNVTTIEGVAAPDGTLHPIQQAFLDEAALQCGYCTPGMILASLALLRDDPSPSEAQIAEWLSGNICRCTGYVPIVRAVLAAASALRE